MPRKELQALCKQHSLPANKTNLAMADALSACLSSSSSVSPLPLALLCMKSFCISVMIAKDVSSLTSVWLHSVWFSC
jgi:hypothetical protein